MGPRARAHGPMGRAPGPKMALGAQGHRAEARVAPFWGPGPGPWAHGPWPLGPWAQKIDDYLLT